MSRLQVLEGKEGAKYLIDNKLLEETQDKYGRHAYKFSRDISQAMNAKRQKLTHNNQMELDAGQAARVRQGLMAASFSRQSAGGGGGGGSSRKPPKEQDPAAKAKADLMIEAKKQLKKIADNRISLETLMISTSKSTHPLAKDIVQRLQAWKETMLSKEQAVGKLMISKEEMLTEKKTLRPSTKMSLR